MIVSVAYEGGMGGTFLSWSLYFLSGKTEYFEFKKNKITQVTSNPLTKRNAHGFSPNREINSELWTSLVNNKNNINANDLHVLDIHPAHNIMHTEINRIVDLCDKVIVLTVPNEHRFYHQRYEKRGTFPKFTDPTSSADNNDDYHNDFIEHFFNDSKQTWEELGLHDVWDHREFLALNLRPAQEDKITNYIECLDKNTFYLDSRDLWCNLDYSIAECLHWLGLQVDQTRFDKWLKVYYNWRRFHYNRVQFSWYFEKIISAILHNDYIDLSRFNLDIMQEAVIQHELIYKYNLNLKTYKLEKFTDTMQLHNLLEENFHPVNDIYNIKNQD